MIWTVTQYQDNSQEIEIARVSKNFKALYSFQCHSYKTVIFLRISQQDPEKEK
jgi:hypothetical protein